MRIYPGQPLWVSENWDVAGYNKVKKQLLHPRRGDVMRRLDKHVARVSKREQLAAPKLGYKIRGNVVVSASH
jgi:hypothetical protein